MSGHTCETCQLAAELADERTRCQTLEAELRALRARPCRCNECRDCLAADGYEACQEALRTILALCRDTANTNTRFARRVARVAGDALGEEEE